MIDLDSPETTEEQREHGYNVWMSIKHVCDSNVRYDIKEKYVKVVAVKGACEHMAEHLQVTFLELADGRGALTAISAAVMASMEKDKCEECYVKEFANYSEMHGFPVFTEGTISQIRYANKVRAKAHMKHGSLVAKAIDIMTEPSWWLDNSKRMHHAKIWREMNSLKDDELTKMNNEIKMNREMIEERRFHRTMKNDEAKRKLNEQK